MKRKIKLVVFNVLILFLLLASLEAYFRYQGDPPGYLPDEFDPPQNLEFHHPYWVDSSGVHSLRFLDYHGKRQDERLNSDGFVSPYEFSLESDTFQDDKAKVLLVGDSYALGFEADPLDRSFASLLDQVPEVRVFNFGIMGMDPVQYRVVLEKYISRIKPDLVLVTMCLQNDLLYYQREPRPFVPLMFKVRGVSYLPTEVYDGSKLIQFSSFEESYNWYFKNFTLLGEDRSLFEQLLGKSVLFTKVYLKIKMAWFRDRLDPLKHQFEYTKNEMAKIEAVCAQANVPLLVLGIPTPKDVQEADYREKYRFLFGGPPFYLPEPGTIAPEDYTGVSLFDHFTNDGHYKFFNFAREKMLHVLDSLDR